VLADTVEAYQLEVHAYALMPDHNHLLVRSVYGTLSRGMRHLNGVFTQRLNARNGWDGALFRGRLRPKFVVKETSRGARPSQPTVPSTGQDG
jgi:REP element-mobilizing transposase RayT